MTIKDFKKLIKSLENHYTKEQIDKIQINYEIFENNEFVVAKAVLEETTIEDVDFPDETSPILMLILSEFKDDEDNRERILGMPINLN